jgi:hypothetical protein
VEDPNREGSYYYKAKLLSGFKYRYCFLLENNELGTVDEDKECSIDKTGKQTNVIKVPRCEDADYDFEVENVPLLQRFQS